MTSSFPKSLWFGGLRWTLAEDDSNWLCSSSFPCSLYPRGCEARRRFVRCFPRHDLEDELSREGVYWFGQDRPYIHWIRLLLVLPYTGVLTVEVTSFQEREQILGLF
jgi:hypothetical protein